MRAVICLLMLSAGMAPVSATAAKPEPLRVIAKANHEHMAPVFSCGGREYRKEDLLALVTAAWQDKKQVMDYRSCRFLRDVQSVFIAAHHQGEMQRQLWSKKPENVQDLVGYIQKFRQDMGAPAVQLTDNIELGFSHTYTDVDFQDAQQRTRFLSQGNRGVIGIEFSFANVLERYPPSYFVHKNRKHEKLVDVFLERHKLRERDLGSKARLRTFYADQYMVLLQDKPSIHAVFRGNEVVNVSEVTQAETRKWARRSSDWLVNNVHDDGRLTYKYFTSQQRESDSNNMIRQWMASVALTQVAARSGSTAYMNLAEKNIDYNLQHFYHEEDTRGIIEYDGSVKLGALSLAGVALIQHPKRDKWRRQIQALERTIISMWREDGSFVNFLKPSGQTGGDNFYPGETLLFWALQYEKKADPILLMRFMKSFEYYRNWHLHGNNRNPAFVPWHTQAYYIIWKMTKQAALKEFIFTMNDWLVDVMQQRKDQGGYSDIWGRFYTDQHNYGPPHASADGVYLEGLIDAYELAKAVGDKKHADKYRVSIAWTIRSLMQLQFVDEIDMFYVPKALRDYVYGGLRTTVYENEIRCDNIQHGLMGVFKVIDRFKPEDYRTPDV